MSNKTNNLKAYLRDLYEGIVSKKPDASRNPQNFRSEIEAIRTGGELYEVMDASELPEDAPNGSLALVEVEGIPQAYTVSSVDELPSNAVDGSMAIVESDSIKGKWIFNDTLNFDCLKVPDNSRIQLIVTGQSYERGLFTSIYIKNEDGSRILSLLLGDDTEYDLYFDDAWDGQSGFDFLTGIDGMYISYFDGVDIDYPTLEEDVNTFITTNAERLSGGYSLYTHENGQWVYKCEVV